MDLGGGRMTPRGQSAWTSEGWPCGTQRNSAVLLPWWLVNLMSQLCVQGYPPQGHLGTSTRVFSGND